MLSHFNFYPIKGLMLGLVLLFDVSTPLWADWNNLLLGQPSSTDAVIERQGYALGYREAHEQAAWVCYQLSAQEVQTNVAPRNDNFRPDPWVTTGSATLADYQGSGYDRGHLAPAADMHWSVDAMDASFYLSNMSPQLPAFNRGIWARLEAQVRENAVAAGDLWVVTGPVLEAGLPTIGASKVSVPNAYYKVLLDEAPQPRMLAFLLPQHASGSTRDYVVSVDAVERATGLDFFSALPDAVEDRLEAGIEVQGWSFKAVSKGKSGGSGSTGEAAPQCKGRTQKGAQCRKLTRDPSGYCHLHRNQSAVPQVQPTPEPATAGQCAAITQKGTRCSRRASKGQFCWQHAK